MRRLERVDAAYVISDRGGGHHHDEQQPERVGDDMALSSWDFFGVIAVSVLSDGVGPMQGL